MTDINKPMTLSDVLRGGRQCDEEGEEIIMSRQACCEAADTIDRLTLDCEKFANQTFKAKAEAKTLVDHANAERDKCGSGAERYRWLRNHPTYMGWEHDFRGDEIDCSLDADIAKDKS